VSGVVNNWTTQMKTADHDLLVPDPVVWREFGVTPMTGWRWTHNPSLGFPPAVKINRRNFRSRQQLEEFKTRLLRDAMTRARAGEVA
jgi:hypothetical protein